MLDKLEQIAHRYGELTEELSSPELLANPSAYGKAAKQHRALGEVVRKYQEWKGLTNELVGARELLDTSDDDEMREMARLELRNPANKTRHRRKGTKTAAHPERSERREERDSRDSRGNRRRRSYSVCSRDGADVFALR